MKVNLQYFGGRGANSKRGQSSGGIPKNGIRMKRESLLWQI